MLKYILMGCPTFTSSITKCIDCIRFVNVSIIVYNNSIKILLYNIQTQLIMSLQYENQGKTKPYKYSSCNVIHQYKFNLILLLREPTSNTCASKNVCIFKR